MLKSPATVGLIVTLMLIAISVVAGPEALQDACNKVLGL